MRNVAFVSALFALILVGAPTQVASADELVSVSTSSSPPETEAELMHRLQVVPSIDANDVGTGFRLGLRYRWAELMGGGDLTFDDARTYFGVKLLLFPEAVVTPYVFGHMGTWSHQAVFGDKFGGDYRAVGGGLDMHTSLRTFFFVEMGVVERTGVAPPTGGGGDMEVRMGFGARL